MAKPASHIRKVGLAMALFAAIALPIACQHADADPTTHLSKPRSSTAQDDLIPVPSQAAGPITIEQPTELATVGRAFTVSGQSSTSGGLLEWELRFDGVAIDSGTTHGGDGTPGHFQFVVRAPAPGSYEIAIFEARGAQGGYSKLTTRIVTVS